MDIIGSEISFRITVTEIFIKKNDVYLIARFVANFVGSTILNFNRNKTIIFAIYGKLFFCNYINIPKEKLIILAFVFF